MKRERGVLAKLILLERLREQAAREALARGCEAEVHARAAEREAAAQREAAAEELASAVRAPVGEGSLQALLLRGRWSEQLRGELAGIEVEVAGFRRALGAAEEARRGLEAGWSAARARRERLEERREADRREARRRREDALEQELDDLPPRVEEAAGSA